MKKFLLSLSIAVIAINVQAQKKDYNRLSVDFGLGVHNVSTPVSVGNELASPGFGFANIGVRYMFNTNFGVRGTLGYHEFTEASGTPIKSNYYRTSLEGIANIGSLLGFEKWTQRFNLLGYAGGGLSSLSTIQPVDRGPDGIWHYVAGITPQFKLSNKVSLFADVSTIFHQYQDASFDGSQIANPDEISNSLLNFGLGVNVAIGKKEKHADFYRDAVQKEPKIKEPKKKKERTKKEKVSKKDNSTDKLSRREQRRLERERRRAMKETSLDPEEEIEVLKTRLAKAENEIEELKTKEAANPNKELIMTELDERYVKREELENGKYADRISGGNVGFIRALLDRGYINVFFDTGKSEVQQGSMNEINYLKQFLKDNPYFRANIIGYADETGSTSGNERLSSKRAKAVFDILVDAGINPSRMTYAGAGVDATVSGKARQFARRVTFQIIQ